MKAQITEPARWKGLKMLWILRNGTRLYLLAEPLLYSWEFWGFVLIYLGITHPANILVPLAISIIFSVSYWLYKMLMGGWKIFPFTRQPSPYIFMTTYLASGLLVGVWMGFLFERGDFLHVLLIVTGLLLTIFPGINKESSRKWSELP